VGRRLFHRRPRYGLGPVACVAPDGIWTDLWRSCRERSKTRWRSVLPWPHVPGDRYLRRDWIGWVSHRLSREADILRALEHGPATAARRSPPKFYTETRLHCWVAATRNGPCTILMTLQEKKQDCALGPLSPRPLISRRFKNSFEKIWKKVTNPSGRRKLP